MIQKTIAMKVTASNLLAKAFDVRPWHLKAVALDFPLRVQSHFLGKRFPTLRLPRLKKHRRRDWKNLYSCKILFPPASSNCNILLEEPLGAFCPDSHASTVFEETPITLAKTRCVSPSFLRMLFTSSFLYFGKGVTETIWLLPADFSPFSKMSNSPVEFFQHHKLSFHQSIITPISMGCQQIFRSAQIFPVD